MTDNKNSEESRSRESSGRGTGRGRHRRSRVTGVLALLAFLIAASLAAAAAWYWQQMEERLAGVEALESELEAQNEQLTEMEAELRRLEDLPARSDRLGDELQSLASEQEVTRTELGRLDERTESLREFVDAGRSAWQIAEVEYLLRLANRELQLAGRPENALAALTAADERLEAMADPGMVPVREAISRDRERLAAVERPDITGMALTLGSLIERVDSLPIAEGVREPPAVDLDEELASAGFWSRLRERTTRVLRQLVTVRHEDAPVRPLLAPEQEYFLRRNLSLALASARLALLQDRPEVWRASVGEARDWLDAYFRMEDDSVQAVDEELARLAASPLRAEQSDVSESLDRLRRIMEVRN